MGYSSLALIRWAAHYVLRSSGVNDTTTPTNPNPYVWSIIVKSDKRNRLNLEQGIKCSDWLKKNWHGYITEERPTKEMLAERMTDELGFLLIEKNVSHVVKSMKRVLPRPARKITAKPEVVVEPKDVKAMSITMYERRLAQMENANKIIAAGMVGLYMGLGSAKDIPDGLVDLCNTNTEDESN